MLTLLTCGLWSLCGFSAGIYHLMGSPSELLTCFKLAPGLDEPYSGVFAFPVAVEWQGYLLCSPFHATVLTLVPSRSVSSRFELTRLFARSVNKPEAPRHFPLHPALAPKQGKAGLVPVAPASTASPLDALIACVAASMPLPS